MKKKTAKNDSKKQIEKAIENAEIQCKRCYGKLSDWQFKALGRIREKCPGIRPRWERPNTLVCCLVMQGLSGRWQEQRFAFYFEEPEQMQWPQRSKWNRKGEFVDTLEWQVLAVLREIEKEIAAENPLLWGMLVNRNANQKTR